MFVIGLFLYAFRYVTSDRLQPQRQTAITGVLAQPRDARLQLSQLIEYFSY